MFLFAESVLMSKQHKAVVLNLEETVSFLFSMPWWSCSGFFFGDGSNLFSRGADAVCFSLNADDDIILSRAGMFRLWDETSEWMETS